MVALFRAEGQLLARGRLFRETNDMIGFRDLVESHTTWETLARSRVLRALRSCLAIGSNTCLNLACSVVPDFYACHVNKLPMLAPPSMCRS